jgi:hypothetical protein
MQAGYAEGVTATQFFLAWVVAGAASIAVFLHASKHGNRHATAWGAGVFLALIVFLPLYVLRFRSAKAGGRRY